MNRKYLYERKLLLKNAMREEVGISTSEIKEIRSVFDKALRRKRFG